ncbi:cytochrome P450 [Thozetella sp. PMI_491]|nr:cytochrome P450 [Thozetella sp. PMI_491]
MYSFIEYAELAGAGLLLYFVGTCIYNLTLHPLAHIPGPLLYRATRLGMIRRHMKGKLPFEVLDLHRKYGDVVRIAPDEVAFAHPDAWREIYGHRPGGSTGPVELPKWKTFYRNQGVQPNIFTEDKENHAMLRRMLAPGFSDRAMRDQESIIGGYIDMLIQQLRVHSAVRPSDLQGEGDEKIDVKVGGRKAIDLTTWYTWTTFDVIGDLAFGESFGCLDRADYDPFVAQLNATGPASAWMFAFKMIGLDKIIFPLLRFFVMRRRPFAKVTTEKLQRRMALKEERPDLIGGLLKKKEAMNLTKEHIRSNAGLLVIAGSETTATLLSGVTYLLLKNPEALKKLTEEVRSTFKSEEEITLLSVGRLSYMLACLDEGLRSYPPVAIGFPRQVPEGGTMVAGEFLPQGTICAAWQWALYHNEKNFQDPFGYHPERFMGDPRFADDKFELLQPFSVGPRNCIGRNLAYAEMRLILARLVYNFDIQLVDERQDWLDQKVYLLWNKLPLQVYLTPVNASE